MTDSKDRTNSNEQPWTVLRLLEWTTDFFKQRGSDSPRLDAEVLLAHARDCSRIELYTAFGQEPTSEERVAFRELVRRRGEGSPVAQLVGYREFYSLKFRVSEDVLIPRPETEHLVVEAIDYVKSMQSGPIRVLDIGTGSGAIAVTLAKYLPEAEITAVDCSEAAIKIATWNAEQHGVSDRIRFIHSDLFEALDAEMSFDIICTNPPYVSQVEYDQLAPSVRDFEPRQALLAGPLGTEVVEVILRESPRYMTAGGRLIIELSPMIADACEELARGQGRYTEIKFIKDLVGHRRLLSMVRE
ncbi:MAG: peptide chain release factor N(5)-glutamine methyltransferase [Planctomycetota bacterium]|nr:peptide chain release factor N(5)-glutamine methyltransferase [Planctomycetota bacterium]